MVRALRSVSPQEMLLHTCTAAFFLLQHPYLKNLLAILSALALVGSKYLVLILTYYLV